METISAKQAKELANSKQEPEELQRKVFSAIRKEAGQGKYGVLYAKRINSTTKKELLRLGFSFSETLHTGDRKRTCVISWGSIFD